MDDRLQQMETWLATDIGLPPHTLTPASVDASFRRYFRVEFDGESRIVMDAPPQKEDVRPFVRVGRQLRAIGLNVPEILSVELAQGFLLLTDLGHESYLDALNETCVARLYGDALGALAVLQACGPQEGELPPYDEALLLQEMSLFRDWLVQRHLGIKIGTAVQAMLAETFLFLVANALEQPQVAVHRDYHARNLMVCAHNPGILDFQDAMYGPVTYDLASLLRDCYIAWPQARVEGWTSGYYALAVDHGILRGVQEETFRRWFDLMGMQRHLKAAGIFARLNHRDGKPGYLDDIPRTLGYVSQVGRTYHELTGLTDFIDNEVLPRL